MNNHTYPMCHTCKCACVIGLRKSRARVSGGARGRRRSGGDRARRFPRPRALPTPTCTPVRTLARANTSGISKSLVQPSFAWLASALGRAANDCTTFGKVNFGAPLGRAAKYCITCFS
eukprot:5871171-Prymnesium_polylepis.1